MPKGRYKIKNGLVPIENHCTAAWADAESIKADSKVNLPNETQIRNAKEYVDTNQK
ncbi:MAG: CDIF630_02480 family spore surface protein [Caldicoprobacterales bacterium]|nr:DUF3787 domain-containing protein [Clostridiales bacterium]